MLSSPFRATRIDPTADHLHFTQWESCTWTGAAHPRRHAAAPLPAPPALLTANARQQHGAHPRSIVLCVCVLPSLALLLLVMLPLLLSTLAPMLLSAAALLVAPAAAAAAAAIAMLVDWIGRDAAVIDGSIDLDGMVMLRVVVVAAAARVAVAAVCWPLFPLFPRVSSAAAAAAASASSSPLLQHQARQGCDRPRRPLCRPQGHRREDVR